MIQEKWADNNSVKLHYLDYNAGADPTVHTPAVFIHGAVGDAGMYRSMLEALGPRRGLAVTLRGRGKSDAPESGYSFEHHVSDIAAIVGAARLTNFCLVAFSVGVTWALGIAIREPERVRGLVLMDYPARVPATKVRWAEEVLAEDELPPHVAWGIQRESREIQLWGDLHKITCPAMVLRGGREGSLLSAENAQRYLDNLAAVQVLAFEDSGHDLSEPDPAHFERTILAFLARSDNLRGRG